MESKNCEGPQLCAQFTVPTTTERAATVVSEETEATPGGATGAPSACPEGAVESVGQFCHVGLAADPGSIATPGSLVLLDIH